MGGGWFRDNGVGEGCQAESGVRKNFGNQNSRNGKKEASPRRHGGHGEGIRQKGNRGFRGGRGSDSLSALRLAAARKPSAERNGFSLFAFPAMNRWAFFLRPAERDCISEAERIVGCTSRWHQPHICKRPTQAKEACVGHPARKPSAEWNRNILLLLRWVASCQ